LSGATRKASLDDVLPSMEKADEEELQEVEDAINKHFTKRLWEE